MSELIPPEDAEIVVAKKPRKGRWLRITGWFSGSSTLMIFAIILGLYLWASSSEFENTVRKRVVHILEDATGGRVEIGSFHWNLLHLQFEADGITIHGLEAANEAPYAHISKLKVDADIFGLFTMGATTRIVLHSVEVERPEYHLIVFADGTTNQPHPRHPPKQDKPVLDTLFDLRVGLLNVREGSLHIADSIAPLDFVARDAGVQLDWIPPSVAANVSKKSEPEGAYRIALQLADLDFAQGPLVGKVKPMPGKLDATAVLTHSGLFLQQLRLLSFDRTLVMQASLNDFAHPVWHGSVEGQVDLRTIAPAAGMPFLRSGILSLKVAVNGHGGDYLAEGDVSTGEVHYQDLVVDAHVGSLTAHLRATPTQLLVSNVDAKLVQGGEVTGEFFYDNWLAFTPLPGSKALAEFHRTHTRPPTSTGRIRGALHNVTLDTLLEMLAVPQYRKLGLDALINGPATADWTNLAADLQIGGQLGLAPTGKTPPGEAPVNGLVDGLYRVETGSIQVRTLDVRTPHSSLEGNGSLGVFPIDRGSEMNLDLRSQDLSEFDATLRALKLVHGTRTGTAALPGILTGPAYSGSIAFQGRLHSSWISPRVEGHLTGTNVGIEIPTPNADDPPRFVSWDSIDVDGMYSPASIVVHHGVLHRGAATLTLDGHVDSSNPNFNLTNTGTEFDANATLAVHADAEQVPIEDLLPLAAINAPVTGKLSAHLSFEGKANNLNGTGSADLSKATVYGEPVEHIRASGSIAGQQLQIASLTAERGAGRINATGSYNLDKQNFRVDARGAAIEIGDLKLLKDTGMAVTGKLGFTVIGDGSLGDPRLTTHATLSSMTLAGEPVSDLLFSATTHQRAVTYDVSSHQPAGEFSAHGDTALTGQYLTQAHLQFGKFDVGALLKLLKVTGINGNSNLEGTASFSGPLADPKKMSGEATLRELAVVVQGVHLQSKGAVHATMSGGIAQLDPIEITGEDTDLKLRGRLDLSGQKTARPYRQRRRQHAPRREPRPRSDRFGRDVFPDGSARAVVRSDPAGQG